MINSDPRHASLDFRPFPSVAGGREGAYHWACLPGVRRAPTESASRGDARGGRRLGVPPSAGGRSRTPDDYAYYRVPSPSPPPFSIDENRPFENSHSTSLFPFPHPHPHPHPRAQAGGVPADRARGAEPHGGAGWGSTYKPFHLSSQTVPPIKSNRSTFQFQRVPLHRGMKRDTDPEV